MKSKSIKGDSASRTGQDLPPARAKKLTPWFPARVKPARIGLYSVMWYPQLPKEHIEWCWWDGKRWAWSYPTMAAARRWKSTKNAFQEKTWRGLASNPKAKA